MAQFLAQAKICASEAISADKAGMIKEASTLYDASAELIILGVNSEFNLGVREQLLKKVESYKARSQSLLDSYEKLREEKRERALRDISSTSKRGPCEPKKERQEQAEAQTETQISLKSQTQRPIEANTIALEEGGGRKDRRVEGLEEEVERLRRLCGLQEEIVDETKAELHRLRGIVDGQHSTIRALSRGREITRDAYISGIVPSSSPQGISPFKVWASYEPPFVNKTKSSTDSTNGGSVRGGGKTKARKARPKSRSRSKSPYVPGSSSFVNPTAWNHKMTAEIPDIFEAEALTNQENVATINRSMTGGATSFSEGRAQDRDAKQRAAERLSRSPGPGRVRICLACNHNGDMPSPPTEAPKKLKSALKTKAKKPQQGIPRSRSPKQKQSSKGVCSPTRFKFSRGAQLASEAEGILAQINATLFPPKKPYSTPSRLSVSAEERLVEGDLDLSLM